MHIPEVIEWWQEYQRDLAFILYCVSANLKKDFVDKGLMPTYQKMMEEGKK